MANVPPPYHLSVVLSGAISLGAYHAGAVAQLGAFAANWNAYVDAYEGDSPPPRILIDVVSGASAGAMTGAVLTHFIGTGFYATHPEFQGQDPLLNLGRRIQRFVQLNFDTWCRKLSFSELLSPQNATEPSILSNSLLEALAAEALTPADPSLPNGQTRLIYTCTLTAFTKLPFPIRLPDATLGVPQQPAVPIYGTTRRDWVTYWFQPQDKAEDPTKATAQRYGNNASYATESCQMMELASRKGLIEGNEKARLWGRFAAFALASGAFPLAWNPIDIERYTRFYPPQFSEGYRSFKYMDGGVIDNMPLGRAAKVIRDYAIQQEDASNLTGLFENRGYVLIEVSPPDEQLSVVDPTSSNGLLPRRDTTFPLLDFPGPLFESLREQSFFADLLTAKQINDRLSALQGGGWDLFALIAGQIDEPTSLRIDKELDHLLQGSTRPYYRHESPEEVAERIRQERAKLIRQYSLRPDFKERQEELDPKTFSNFVRLCALIDLYADLSHKHRMQVLRMAPAKPLHGAILGAFGGFVKTEYMERDFVIGMQTCRRRLEKFLLDSGFDPASHAKCFAGPETIPAISFPLTEDPWLPEKDFPSGLDKVPDQERGRFLTNLYQRFTRMAPGLVWATGLASQFTAPIALVVAALLLSVGLASLAALMLVLSADAPRTLMANAIASGIGFFAGILFLVGVALFAADRLLLRWITGRFRSKPGPKNNPPE